MQTSIASQQSAVTLPIESQTAVRTNSQSNSRFNSQSWLWLGIAGILLLFANGANNVALAAWLAPVFLLRFVRLQRSKIAIPAAYLLLMAAFAFQFRGMVPIPGLAYGIFLIVWAIPMVIPYALDRVLAHRLKGFAASLVFPATWAATEYVVSRGLYGSWGSAAYSQFGNLPFIQIVSVTGLWGITFLIGLFASLCNQLWEGGLKSKNARLSILLWVIGVATVTILGGLRLTIFPPSSRTVRIASISRRDLKPELSDAVSSRMFAGQSTDEDLLAIRTWAAAMDSDLLIRAERELQAGAKIVFWGETNAPVLKEDESALVARGSELAAKYHAYVGMALGVLDRGTQTKIENKLVLIQPNGQVAWEYNKARPVPGPEAAMQVRGDGKMYPLDTPYGKLSSVICFDGDFPQLLAQAGTMGADLVIDPSNDWRAIDPWHTQMVSFRAIEQGFNIVRGTSRGLSAAYDYQGRQLSAMDYYHTSDYAMIADVPTKGVHTIYSKLGDWFAWLCLAIVAALAAAAFLSKRT